MGTTPAVNVNTKVKSAEFDPMSLRTDLSALSGQPQDTPQVISTMLPRAAASAFTGVPVGAALGAIAGGRRGHALEGINRGIVRGAGTLGGVSLGGSLGALIGKVLAQNAEDKISPAVGTLAGQLAGGAAGWVGSGAMLGKPKKDDSKKEHEMQKKAAGFGNEIDKITHEHPYLTLATGLGAGAAAGGGAGGATLGALLGAAAGSARGNTAEGLGRGIIRGGATGAGAGLGTVAGTALGGLVGSPTIGALAGGVAGGAAGWTGSGAVLGNPAGRAREEEEKQAAGFGGMIGKAVGSTGKAIGAIGSRINNTAGAAIDKALDLGHSFADGRSTALERNIGGGVVGGVLAGSAAHVLQNPTMTMGDRGPRGNLMTGMLGNALSQEGNPTSAAPPVSQPPAAASPSTPSVGHHQMSNLPDPETVDPGFVMRPKATAAANTALPAATPPDAGFESSGGSYAPKPDFLNQIGQHLYDNRYAYGAGALGAGGIYALHQLMSRPTRTRDEEKNAAFVFKLLSPAA